MENIYVSLRIFKNKSLIGRSLVYTVLIFDGNQTQVTFSGIIPLDYRDICRYCQYRSNEQKQIAYNIYMQEHNQKFFRAGKVSLNKGTSISLSSKNQGKKLSSGKFWSFLF